MKRANGTGSIIKLSGKRRRPFQVKKVKDWNEKGQPVYTIVGYFESRSEAEYALADFNREPYDVKARTITMAELYKLWLEKKAGKLGSSNVAGLQAAYGHVSILYKMKYAQIKAYHMQEVVDNCGCGRSTQATIKNLFYHLDRFAKEIEVCGNMYSELVSITEKVSESKKKPFTTSEVAAIWNIKNNPWADSALVLLYTGMRIGELLTLKPEHINLDDRLIRHGIKTAAGKGRAIPIHSEIFGFIESRVNNRGEFLFDFEGKECSKQKYYSFWKNIISSAGISKHTPHECRHTFRSRLDSLGANEVCIDRIVGHKSQGVGRSTYTHKELDELRDTINMLHY